MRDENIHRAVLGRRLKGNAALAALRAAMSDKETRPGAIARIGQGMGVDLIKLLGSE